MKFIADRMLGSFAKWLRVYGFDVFYSNDIDRSSMIKISRDEGRLILTRASNFKELKHVPPYFIINSENLEGQLKEFFMSFPDLKKKGIFFSRCVECNVPLKDVPKEAVADKVPEHAFKTHDEYKICPSCQRVYWEGTHISRMKDFIDSL